MELWFRSPIGNPVAYLDPAWRTDANEVTSDGPLEISVASFVTACGLPLRWYLRSSWAVALPDIDLRFHISQEFSLKLWKWEYFITASQVIFNNYEQFFGLSDGPRVKAKKGPRQQQWLRTIISHLFSHSLCRWISKSLGYLWSFVVLLFHRKRMDGINQ